MQTFSLYGFQDSDGTLVGFGPFLDWEDAEMFAQTQADYRECTVLFYRDEPEATEWIVFPRRLRTQVEIAERLSLELESL